MASSKPRLKKVGRGLKSTSSNPPRPVELHLVVTRASGDTERFKLGEVPNMLFASAYRKKLTRVTLPRKAA
jgi:hypothetical protein